MQNFQDTIFIRPQTKVDSVFHPSEVGKMSTRTLWELSGKN